MRERSIWGSNSLAIDQFANVDLTASGGILAQGSGGLALGSGALAVAGNLTLESPALTATSGTVYDLTAGGRLSVETPNTGTAAVTGGLGARMALTGASVDVGDGVVALPSGNLTITANGGPGTAGNLVVGGALEVNGTATLFNGAPIQEWTGSVSPVSTDGNVVVASGGTVSVAAQAGGGEPGSLSVSAPAGSFTVAGSAAGDSSPPLGRPQRPGGDVHPRCAGLEQRRRRRHDLPGYSGVSVGRGRVQPIAKHSRSERGCGGGRHGKGGHIQPVHGRGFDLRHRHDRRLGSHGRHDRTSTPAAA